jgi:putative pre-16S rRNA nuclease
MAIKPKSMGMDDDNLKRILAVDFGEKRIGLALSDPLLTFAYPFKTIKNDSGLFKELEKIIEEKNIQRIILGLPSEQKKRLPAGRAGSTSVVDKIRKFKESLIKNFKLEIILWDESFTSVMAKERVIESVSRKFKRRDKGLIDQNSAAIILQEYLDQHGRSY